MELFDTRSRIAVGPVADARAKTDSSIDAGTQARADPLTRVDSTFQARLSMRVIEARADARGGGA